MDPSPDPGVRPMKYIRWDYTNEFNNLKKRFDELEKGKSNWIRFQNRINKTFDRLFYIVCGIIFYMILIDMWNPGFIHKLILEFIK